MEKITSRSHSGECRYGETGAVGSRPPRWSCR